MNKTAELLVSEIATLIVQKYNITEDNIKFLSRDRIVEMLRGVARDQ